MIICLPKTLDLSSNYFLSCSSSNFFETLPHLIGQSCFGVAEGWITRGGSSAGLSLLRPIYKWHSINRPPRDLRLSSVNDKLLCKADPDACYSMLQHVTRTFDLLQGHVTSMLQGHLTCYWWGQLVYSVRPRRDNELLRWMAPASRANSTKARQAQRKCATAAHSLRQPGKPLAPPRHGILSLWQ